MEKKAHKKIYEFLKGRYLSVVSLFSVINYIFCDNIYSFLNMIYLEFITYTILGL